MTKIDWKRKLSSRKFLTAAAGVVMGLAMVFGLDENTISTVAGAVVSVASVVAYIMAEGKVDAESVKKSIDSVQNTDGASGKYPSDSWSPEGKKLYNDIIKSLEEGEQDE